MVNGSLFYFFFVIVFFFVLILMSSCPNLKFSNSNYRYNDIVGISGPYENIVIYLKLLYRYIYLFSLTKRTLRFIISKFISFNITIFICSKIFKKNRFVMKFVILHSRYNKVLTVVRKLYII